MKSNRRNFIQKLGVGTAGIGLSSGMVLSSCSIEKEDTATSHTEDGQLLFVGDDIAIADTQYGKVQGLLLRDIYQFRGIPYGADTSGENRFMPPQPPESWTDVRPALWWGNSAPQIMDNRYANVHYSFADHWNYDDVSEDCLRLNVWTPALGDEKKRPVLVWLHGGGYRNGNAIEQDGYKGENLARKGDAVFVSINHRLGPLGFTDLSAVGGAAFKDSGNVGALDMVAALKWVQENISNFGGDPENVTIMGQSGGGSKVCTIAAMPAAEGMVHKAVPLSGSSTSALDQSYAQKLGEYVVREAGLNANQLDELQQIPWKDYILLANRAAQKLNEDRPKMSRIRGGFRPVADGVNIPKGAFYSDAISDGVPMLICTTFHEWGLSRTNAELEKITADEAKEMLKQRVGFRAGFGDKAPDIYEAYAKTFPEASPLELVTLIASNRSGAVSTAEAKVKQSAPVYMAWFGWEPPMYNGRMRAFHCLDICFWFNNTDLMLTHTGGGARPRALGDKMSDALLSFMRTGNPNTSGLPQWPEYSSEKGEVMILDDTCEVLNDPDRDARQTMV